MASFVFQRIESPSRPGRIDARAPVSASSSSVIGTSAMSLCMRRVCVPSTGLVCVAAAASACQ